jgi:hypothetical protein
LKSSQSPDCSHSIEAVVLQGFIAELEQKAGEELIITIEAIARADIDLGNFTAAVIAGGSAHLLLAKNLVLVDRQVDLTNCLSNCLQTGRK